MPKVDRAKLKKLLEELDSKKVKGIGVAVKAKAGEFITGQRQRRTPEARTARSITGRAEQIARQQSETLLQAEREQELAEYRKAKEAEAQRKRVEREIFETKYGEQIQQAKRLGRGVAKGVAAGTVALGRGLTGVGKYAAGTETIEETRQRVGEAVGTGKRRGFVAEPLRALARERQTTVRERRREDVHSFLEAEGVSRKEVRRERQAGGAFDFPDLEIDIGF